MPNIEPFFVIWNPDHGQPMVKHHNFDNAKMEARRLAAGRRKALADVRSALGIC